jgi:hypothetical protein
MKETDLAERVVAWLKHEGWDVYQEVEGPNGRCDIYAVREPLTWAIEVKATFGLKVIEQAHGWLGHANLVSIATPKPPNGFGLELCRHFGIGTIEIVPRENWDNRMIDSGEKWPNGSPLMRRERVDLPPDLHVHQYSKPRFLRRSARPRLYESQKDYAPAGNNYGKYVTGASEVKRQLVDIVRAEPGIALSEAIKRIPHHYASDRSAKSTLVKYIEWKQVPELRIERDGRLVRLYLAEAA